MKINIDLIYPIGAIYMSVVYKSPEELFGGKWEQIKDTFLLASGDKYQAGTTGGTETHTHNYGIQVGGYYKETCLAESESSGVLSYNTSGACSKTGFDSIGSAAASWNSSTIQAGKTNACTHYRSIGNTSYTNNLPPYLTVYMWKRVS